MGIRVQVVETTVREFTFVDVSAGEALEAVSSLYASGGKPYGIGKDIGYGWAVRAVDDEVTYALSTCPECRGYGKIATVLGETPRTFYLKCHACQGMGQFLIPEKENGNEKQGHTEIVAGGSGEAVEITRVPPSDGVCDSRLDKESHDGNRDSP